MEPIVSENFGFFGFFGFSHAFWAVILVLPLDFLVFLVFPRDLSSPIVAQGLGFRLLGLGSTVGIRFLVILVEGSGFRILDLGSSLGFWGSWFGVSLVHHCSITA